MPYNYSEVLPALLVLLVSYARMIVFDPFEEYWFKFCIVVLKGFLKFYSLFYLLMIFLRLFRLPLDHFCHLNVTYIYLRRLCIFLILILLKDMQQFKHGGV